MKYKKKSDEFKEMMTRLVKLAREDGVITDSEAEILNKVEISLEQYEKALKKAEEDGMITDDEYLILKNIEDNLLQKTFTMIEQDEKLDDDNMRLVVTLFDILMKIL